MCEGSRQRGTASGRVVGSSIRTTSPESISYQQPNLAAQKLKFQDRSSD